MGFKITRINQISTQTPKQKITGCSRFVAFFAALFSTESNMPVLQLVATPDYPVAAGQSVVLRCSSSIKPLSITFSWHHLQNRTWKNVSVGSELILTKPQQSGLYRCQDCILYSQNHTVYIISVNATGWFGSYYNMKLHTGFSPFHAAWLDLFKEK